MITLYAFLDYLATLFTSLLHSLMKLSLFCLLILSLMATGCNAQKFKSDVIYNHISTLANDAMQGRATGTAGESAAAAYIITVFKALGLEPKGDNGTYLQSFAFKGGAHGEGAPGTAANVIGYLDNKASTTVIIGAHYDHLGMDGQHSSLDANPASKVHNGADDNASGVAGVLELARYFGGNGKKEHNNFLFVCFSGEELGLLGSKHLADQSPADLATVNYMINMDMIGRLDPTTKTLIVHGTGTSPVWEPLLKKLATDKLSIKTDSSGTGPSDHTSFYLKNIPVLHFFTGSHSDYHKPSDDTDKINANGEAEVLRLIAAIVEGLDEQPKLSFLKTRTKMQGTRSAFKVTMGIMPSYAGDVEGLKVDGVTEGRPAHKAGIQTGDIIVQMGDYVIKDIQQYMDALGKFEKDQSVPVRVKRSNQAVDVVVVF
jgi:hypothetical protein